MVRRIENGTAKRSRGERWRGLIAEWSGSGQTQVAFCRARGLNAGTFAWWKRQLRRDGWVSAGTTARRGRRARDSGRFIEVHLAGSSRPAYEVVLSHGRTIRLSSDFDPQVVSRLVEAVESAPGIFGGAELSC
jgi:hypothetical protein